MGSVFGDLISVRERRDGACWARESDKIVMCKYIQREMDSMLTSSTRRGRTASYPRHTSRRRRPGYGSARRL
jgi:hypothetical protein